jgi:hypothetical protein
MSGISHDNFQALADKSDFSRDRCLPGGAFVLVENVIDDAHLENAFGLMMSLKMLIEFGDAFDFTGRFWPVVQGSGIQPAEVIHLAGPASAGVAYK